MALLSDLEEEPRIKAEGETFQDQTKSSLGLYYKVVGDGEVEITHHESHYASDFLPGQTLEIPKIVTDEDDNTYTVVGIGEAAFADPSNNDNPSSFSGIKFPLDGDKTTIRYIDTLAFWNCTSVTSLEIPKGVTKIGKEAFHYCTSLQSVKIADTVTEIGYGAFWYCLCLKNIKLPNQISAIQAHTFDSCGGFRSIDIPNSVTEIGEYAFYYNYTSLREMTIPSSVRSIGKYAFGDCSKMNRLNIVVKQDITPVTATETSFFRSSTSERGLYFLTEDGTPLSASTNPSFEDAKAAYDQAGDGMNGDGLWWGWEIHKESTYAVTIKAMLDGQDWDESKYGKKTFALSKDGNTYLEDLTAVAAGTYGIYERIETPEQTAARAVSYQDTKKTVTVVDKNEDKTINYFTATFYDDVVGSSPAPYADTTDQHPQIVLEGKSVAKPPNPSDKSGFSFAGWKTEDGGDFNFAGGLTAKTDIYASWTAEAVDPKTYHLITAKVGENGSISPEGDFEVTEGPDRTFTIKVLEGTDCTFTIRADTDYRIKEVRVDGTDRGARNSYTFTDVDSGHTIEAVFEKTETGGGDEPEPDNPPGGDGGTDSEKPGGSSGGGGSDPDDSDDDHSGGGTSDSGSGSSGGSGGGNSGGSDAGSSGGGTSDGDSAGSTNISVGSSLPEAGAPAKAADAVSGANVNAPRPGEPKTGDASHLEIYASIAMIAGFVYLVLYLMDGMKGMSKEEKNRRIASLLGWAKKGRAKTLRRYIAITAVFFVLAYYHAFGKQAALGWQKA